MCNFNRNRFDGTDRFMRVSIFALTLTIIARIIFGVLNLYFESKRIQETPEEALKRKLKQNGFGR